MKGFFFSFILLLCAFNTKALEVRFWGAFKDGRTFMSNYDIENYICALHLSDNEMIAMFKKANGDYDQYENLRRTWAQRRFKSGLKQFAYVYTVQQHSKTNYNNKTGAFKITSSDYFERSQELETKTLRKWLDQNQGIVKARIAFAKELMAIGYPHKENQDPTELYFEWFDLQKKRLKEKLRLQEVQKYEYLTLRGHRTPNRFMPGSGFDLIKEVTAHIEENIQGKRLTPKELATLIQADERISIIASQINLMGPTTLPLDELANDAPEVYEDFKERALNLFNSPLEKADDYLRAATSISQGMDAKGIKTKIEESRKMFLLQRDNYTELVKAKIYELALEMKNGSTMDENIVNQFKSDLNRKAQKIIESAFNNPKKVERRLEDHLMSELTNHDLEGANAKAVNLLNWVAKFQLKKVSLEITPVANATLIDTNKWEGQDRVRKYIEHVEYEEDLENFRRNTLARVGHYITLNPDGEGNQYGYDTWNYVLEQF